ncbi:MAG: nucleotidyltransferase domain-containing protein [Desulfobacca sp.]|nr:nucleotidyltransferase domain-containing protein [Desulfobacca sp.]
MPDLLHQKRAAYAARLQESLDRLITKLSALEEVERLSLVGSYARGRADLFTDLDILVIMRTELSWPERLCQLYGLLALPVDLDLFCYTPEEFAALRERPFLKNLLQKEVVLYERKAP